MTRPRVLLVSSGLEHARRGFESFARECFEALRGSDGLEIELVKGSGSRAPGERVVPTLRRDGVIARSLARPRGTRPFRIEALTFAFSLQPLLLAHRPDVVYLSEWDTARALVRLRRVTGLSYRVAFSNGAPVETAFDGFDLVQELTPAALDWVLERGAERERHAVLPYGFEIPPQLCFTSPEARLSIRRRLGLPSDRPVIVSLSALNSSHKRLDYLIDEVAALPEPRPFLVMAGEPDRETPALRSLAAQRLGSQGHTFMTLPRDQVNDLLDASDLFVLASLYEAQGRVLVEAMSRGLPCVAHESSVVRFALGQWGRCGDLALSGILTRLLTEELNLSPEARRDRAQTGHQHVYERFSWDRLTPRYVEFLTSAAGLS